MLRLLALALLASPASAQLLPGAHLSGRARLVAPTLLGDWSRRFDHGIAGHDSGAACAIDSQGNALVSGSSLGQFGSAYSYEINTLKYAPGGALLWEGRYHSAGSGFNDTAVAVAIGPQDSVYVLGQGPGSSGNQDVVLIKYDAQGVQQWARRYDQNWSDGATDLEVNASGEAYVAGNSTFGTNYTDIVLLKYDAAGNNLWTRNWHGGYGTDYPFDIELDAQGSLALVGEALSAPSGSTNLDWVVQKWDGAGTLLWSQKVASAGTPPDYSAAVAVAPNGDVFATGGLSGGLATVRFAANGAQLWLRTEALGAGKDVCCDGAGNAYLTTGTSVLKYDPAGALLWNLPFTVAGANTASATSILWLAPYGLALAGSASVAGVGSQFGAAAWNADGVSLGSATAGAPYQATPATHGLATAWGGRMLLAGSSSNGHDQDALSASFSLQ